MSRKDTQPRIAIIGAGPAGLSAAWFLKRNGYRRVRVFEKTDRVGGKCLTFEHGGHRFDLAAHEMLAGYNDVMDIANALGVPSMGYQNVLVFDTDNRRYLSMMEASQTGGYGKLQILWASLRYTWMLLTRYRKFARPGSGYAGAPPELMQPLSSWIQEKQLGALLETIMYVMRVQGYGRLDEIPAAYFVKFQGLRNWVSNVLHVAGLIQSWPRIFKNGFQSLWDAVAPHVDLVLNANIKSVRREPEAGKSNLVVTIEFADGRPKEEFDYVIVTCPLDYPTLSALGLDLHHQETRLLKQVQYVEFVTTACTVEGVPTGVVGSIPVPPTLDYTGYIKIYEDSPVAIFFSLAPKDYSPDEIYDRIKRQVRALPDYRGKSGPAQSPHVTGLVRGQGWQYFPHVSLTEFRAGFYDQFESLQGYRQTYYSGSLLAYETVGTTVAYSRQLVDRCFPPLD